MTCLLCFQPYDQPLTFVQLFSFACQPAGICPDCRAGFCCISEKHCPTCYKDQAEIACQDCQTWVDKGIQVRHAALYRYNEAMKDYFSRFKFLGDYCLRQAFAQDFKAFLTQFAQDQKDWILVPIPVSEATLAERGFNQVSALLDAARLPYQDLLTKADGPKQSSKTRLERLSSPQVFALREGCSVPEKIILIDDIYTTGATLQLAKQLLQAHGAHEIISCSLCR